MVHNVICDHVNDQMGKVLTLASVGYLKRHHIYRSTFDTDVKLRKIYFQLKKEIKNRKIDFETNIAINCIQLFFFK